MQAPAAAAAATAAPPLPPAPASAVAAAAADPHNPHQLALPWETLLHLISTHLTEQQDRWVVRLVSSEWRTAADACWRRAALQPDTLHRPLDEAAFDAGAFLLPWIRELCLVELQSPVQLSIFQSWLHPPFSPWPRALPTLRALTLSTELEGEAYMPILAGRSLLSQLAELQLERLQLYGLQPEGGSLAGFARLHHLTELCISLTADGPHWAMVAVHGVRHLATLRHLQVRGA